MVFGIQFVVFSWKRLNYYSEMGRYHFSKAPEFNFPPVNPQLIGEYADITSLLYMKHNILIS